MSCRLISTITAPIDSRSACAFVGAKTGAEILAYENDEDDLLVSVLFGYAKLAGIPVENLLHDERELWLDPSARQSRLKLYSSCIHIETDFPSFVAGMNLIFLAASMALSVSP